MVSPDRVVLRADNNISPSAAPHPGLADSERAGRGAASGGMAFGSSSQIVAVVFGRDGLGGPLIHVTR